MGGDSQLVRSTRPPPLLHRTASLLLHFSASPPAPFLIIPAPHPPSVPPCWRSLEPALNDATLSSAFQIKEWNESAVKGVMIQRAILPAKTLQWIDMLERLNDVFKNANKKMEFTNILHSEESADVEGEGHALQETVSKYAVFGTLAEFVIAHLKAADDRCGEQPGTINGDPWGGGRRQCVAAHKWLSAPRRAPQG